VIEGIEEFREHLGGELSIPLLTQIGSMKNVHKIDKFKMAQAFREVKEIHLKQ
jgi:3-dehydroquinate synthase